MPNLVELTSDEGLKEALIEGLLQIQEKYPHSFLAEPLRVKTRKGGVERKFPVQGLDCSEELLNIFRYFRSNGTYYLVTSARFHHGEGWGRWHEGLKVDDLRTEAEEPGLFDEAEPGVSYPTVIDQLILKFEKRVSIVEFECQNPDYREVFLGKQYFLSNQLILGSLEEPNNEITIKNEVNGKDEKRVLIVTQSYGGYNCEYRGITEKNPRGEPLSEMIDELQWQSIVSKLQRAWYGLYWKTDRFRVDCYDANPISNPNAELTRVEVKFIEEGNNVELSAYSVKNC